MAVDFDFTRGWPFELVRPGEKIPLTELRLREQAMARAPLLAGLPKQNLRLLAEVTEVHRYQPETRVVKEGSPGTAFFVILEGKAKVQIGPRTVAGLVAGDFFGEISLLDGGRRNASVVAQTPLLCLKLGASHFLQLLKDEPPLALKVLRGVARRLREAEAGPVG
jgi:CRP/FNR family transcriptional regulator, cyclic AMP receptor protein